ncbi:MAG: hypothetical protein KKD38_06510 [Candidatus Delongbacteria bacterium]|nr:hypothetical protein [Candidatus Delongbacteria bacterium]
MRRQIILILLTAVILIFAQEKSIKQIKQEFEAKKLDMTKVYDTAIELRKCLITSIEDLSDVAEISESIVDYFEDNKSVFKSDRDYFYDYESYTRDCYASFEKIQEKDNYLEPKLLELMKEGQDETRIYAIKALGIIKSKKAAPEFRKKVKGFSNIKYKALGIVSEMNAYNYAIEASVAAEALGSVAEEKDFQLLFDRLYDLKGATGKGLLKMGKRGFDTLVDMARKERKDRDDDEWYASRALDHANTPEYVPEWIKVLKNENDVLIAQATQVVFNNRKLSTSASNYIEQLKKDYLEKKVNGGVLAWALKEEKDIPVLVHILENEKDIYILQSCLENISWLGTRLDDPSTVIAALEKIVYNDGNKEVLSRASSAIIKIGEKGSLLRLESYLINNIGKVNKNKGDDEIDLREIRKKLDKTQGDK